MKASRKPVESGRLRTSTFLVEGMCCADEEFTIRKKLSSLPGVNSCAFNLVAQKLTVTHSVEEGAICKALRDVGFSPRPLTEGLRSATLRESGWHLYSVLGSGFLTLVGLLLSRPDVLPAITNSVFGAAVLLGGWRIARKGLKAARALAFDMNFLMTGAVIGAMIIDKWEEAAVVTFLFALALWLESYSLKKTRNAIRSLMDLSPAIARVRRNGTEVDLPVENVQIGDHIFIKPGERIPLDGIVVAGYSFVDQAPITGESLPVEKLPGDTLFAGSLNQKGSLEVRVTKPVQDTTLSHIIHLVEEAQSRRAPSQAFVDRFARIYTPAVIGLALLVSIVPPVFFGEPFESWFYRALVLLVIACPCALVISTPVTIVSGLTNAARNGILIKGGVHLEDAGGLKVIAFDKTGTLTRGLPAVMNVIPVDNIPPERIIAIAAAMESHSEHHLADAIVYYAKERGVSYEDLAMHDFEAIPGKGIQASLNGETYYLGNHTLAEEKRICSPEVEDKLQQVEREGKTTIIVGTEKAVLGIIAIADSLRPESKEAIRLLHERGIERIVMLTGDNPGTAKAIADQLKVDEYQAELLPEQKVDAIQSLVERYKKVGMVGDGVNDAPALAAATVGIAMGTVGSDTALEAADIALMSDELPKLSYTILLSRKTLKLIKQNIALSLLIKLTFLALAVPGIATLWMAIAADEGATLVVIFNALRILRTKDRSMD